MKSSDKFLIGIVVGIVVLIIVALVVTLSKPEAAYLADDTPDGVAHNYLLALQKGDYEVAYGYLLPTLPGYPSSEEDFLRVLTTHRWEFQLDRESMLSISSTEVSGRMATVTVTETWLQGGGLFDSSQSSRVFKMQIQQVGGEWKIFNAEEYFATCWRQRQGCY